MLRKQQSAFSFSYKLLTELSWKKELVFNPHSAPQNVVQKKESGDRRQETEFEKKIMTAVIE
ncbi:MAG: hypothetical protein F6K24_49970 [Okeania sp. SIO2D1]|nr:hypothetical protein [Okeania sp. SIO2D1]